MADYKLWIDGRDVEGTSEMQVVNPATEEVFATIARSKEALAEQAIASARAAQKPWAKTSIAERQQCLVRLAAGLNARAGEIARVLTQAQVKNQAR